MTVKELAESAGISRQRVYQIAKTLGHIPTYDELITRPKKQGGRPTKRERGEVVPKERKKAGRPSTLMSRAELADAVVRYRATHDATIKEAAKEFHISATTLARIERADERVRVWTFRKVQYSIERK